MVQFVLSSNAHGFSGTMPASLDVSDWIVSNDRVSGYAFAPGSSSAPFPGYRADRLDFTGTGLAFDGGAHARGTIETIAFKSYGAFGYLTDWTITDACISYQDVVDHDTDIMPVLLRGNDTVIGNDYANRLYGLDGSDLLKGGAGSDILSGGRGNDTLVGGSGADRLDGGAGSDTASYISFAADGSVESRSKGVVANLLSGIGTGGEARGDTYLSIENLTGTNFKDTLGGNNGANTLKGLYGDDWLDGGKGNDRLFGGHGNDTILGGSGDDHIYAGRGEDSVWLGAGEDVLHYASGDRQTTVYDFDAASDRIGLSDVSGVNEANWASFVRETDDGAVLDFGKNDTIVLVGVEAADLTAGDFLF